MAEIKANLADTWFAWSGPTTTRRGRSGTSYYRIQGPTVVIEYAPQPLVATPSTSTPSIAIRPTTTGPSWSRNDPTRARRSGISVAAGSSRRRRSHAHRLDDICSDAAVDWREPDSIVGIDLTPGVAIAERIVGDIDLDGDGRFSAAEADAYARRCSCHCRCPPTAGRSS